MKLNLLGRRFCKFPKLTAMNCRHVTKICLRIDHRLWHLFYLDRGEIWRDCLVFLNVKSFAMKFDKFQKLLFSVTHYAIDAARTHYRLSLTRRIRRASALLKHREF